METTHEMALINGGSYTPLYTTDKTPRVVPSFFLDCVPVTNRQFLDFVKANPKWQRENALTLFADKNYLKHWQSNLELGAEVSPEAPVVNVSWFAARAFASFHDKRLPTVDEWEYVARADATRINATSDPEFTQILLDWYGRPNPKHSESAATFPKNVHGIQAMHGLIWEWTFDFNNAMVTGESRGDSGLDRNLFCAGGAVSSSDVTNYAAFMRYAFRASLKGNYTVENLGFRCARTISPSVEP
jgi:formylglycine-generating enzyme required for sulfatase activity